MKSTRRLVLSLSALFFASCGNTATRNDARQQSPSPAAESVPTTDTKPESPDAGSPMPTATPLPSTTPGEWRWFGAEYFDDVPTCMDGSKTGLGLNRALGESGAKKVLFFMQGGGACFDGQTCAIADKLLSSDHHDARDFTAWSKKEGVSNVMNRLRADNPFHDWNLVMIPYCSGDVFAGDNRSGFQGRPQIGHENVAAYLSHLASTFFDAAEVVIAGTSAGGYGAAYNFVPFQKAFPWLDVTVIDDSAPALATKYTPVCLQQKWRDTWAMDTTSPIEGPFPLGYDPQSGVAGTGLWGLLQALVIHYPKNKFAFISHEDDLVMRYFHGIGHSTNCASPYLLGGDLFEEGLRDIRTMKGDNFSTFYSPGTGHSYFNDDDGMFDVTVDGVALPEWLGDVVTTKNEPRRVPTDF